MDDSKTFLELLELGKKSFYTKLAEYHSISHFSYNLESAKNKFNYVRSNLK